MVKAAPFLVAKLRKVHQGRQICRIVYDGAYNVNRPGRGTEGLRYVVIDTKSSLGNIQEGNERIMEYELESEKGSWVK